MRKEDLKDGMILEMRNEFERVYINNGLYTICNRILSVSVVLRLENYNDDLTCITDKSLDVMKISYQGEILWERDDIDWANIPIDTKVLVKLNNNNNWQKRYFAKYEKGKVYTFMDGSTSWADNNENILQGWDCYRLAINENEIHEDNEVDWSKVPEDTKVLVRDCPSEDWNRRYFAKYENGKFYAYPSGATSWNGQSTLSWNECKLATDED